MTDEVITATNRTQMAVLRRLGQLGATDALGRGHSAFKMVGRFLASVSDAEYDVLLNEVNQSATAVTVVQRRKRQMEEAHTAYRVLESYTGGGPVSDARQARLEAVQVTEAAATLLESMDAGTFTIAEAAERILLDLGYHDYSPLEYDAVKALVNDAVLRAPALGEYEGRLPAFVTFMTDDLGWCRVPIGVASIAQFRWMCQFRTEQAAHLATKAERLREALDIMEEQSEGNDQIRCTVALTAANPATTNAVRHAREVLRKGRATAAA
jgi:hypothetical protein